MCRLQQVQALRDLCNAVVCSLHHVCLVWQVLDSHQGPHISASSLDHRVFILTIQVWVVYCPFVPGKFIPVAPATIHCDNAHKAPTWTHMCAFIVGNAHDPDFIYIPPAYMHPCRTTVISATMSFLQQHNPYTYNDDDNNNS